MARTQTFLQLAPEFGGTKFGPFDQVEIRLGSDPGNSDITLPETLGVAAQHVKLLKQQDDSYILAPVDRTAAVYHFRSGSPRPKQVLAPTAIGNGDAFSLVTPEGPRFAVLVEKDPKQITKSIAESQGPKWPSGINLTNSRFGRGLWNEVKRRGFAAVFTTRLGNMFMRASMMVRSGAIFSPVYIVSGILMLSGWLFVGGTSCSLYSMSKKRNQVQARLSTCQDQLGVANGADGDSTDPTVADLTRMLLEDAEWKNTIDADKALYAAFSESLREIFADASRYKWVYSRKGSPYTQFRSALESSGMPEALVRTLSFAVASPTYDRPWAIVKDSEGAEVCGRGPLALTYRQSFQMGMTLQPDGLADRALADSQDLSAMKALLDATTKSAGATVEYRDDLVKTAGAELQGGMACVYVDGEDDRDDMTKLAKALQENIGASRTKKLPHEGEFYWIASRLVMLYSFDMKAHELEVVSFDARMAPSMSLETKDVKKDRIEFAIDGAGKVMARAAAVPCIAKFDQEKKNQFPDWFLKKEPPLGSCAILKAFVEYDKL